MVAIAERWATAKINKTIKQSPDQTEIDEWIKNNKITVLRGTPDKVVPRNSHLKKHQ